MLTPPSVGGGIASAKTFDMRVVSKSEVADHVFSAISKEEVGPISTFLQSKNVRLKNEMEDSNGMDVDPISDDDDEDMSIPSDDEPKRDKKKGKAKAPAAAADDDEDESGELPE
jgi:structure-specific recognition protein 1